MRSRVRSLALASVVAVLVLAVPAMADSFNVYVGYADSLRPSGFFPNPWIGASGVVAAESGAQTFDSGAVRIDNTGASDINITNMTVTVDPGGADGGPYVFNFWGSLDIPAGDTGVFAQAFSYNFDSSDFGFLPSPIGIDGSHPLGGCTNLGALSAGQQALCAANAPVVSFDENGNPESFTDTGMVINTFGYDFIAGSSDGNESINWNAIGTVVSRGGVPEPSSIFLLGSGLLASFSLLRRKMQKQQ